MCKYCETQAVIILSSGRKLCKNCFIRYFENFLGKPLI